MGMRALITGHCGWIGSNLTELMRSEGHEVEGYDIDDDVRDDLSNVERLTDRMMEFRPHAVIHLAGYVDAAAAETDQFEAIRVNEQGTDNVLTAMTDARVRSIVFASSAAVYGQPVRTPIVASAPVCPVGVYGRTKAHGESAVRRWVEATPGTGIIVRLFNVVPDRSTGGQPSTSGHVVNRLRHAAQTGEPFVINGRDWGTPDGTPVRDFVPMCDVIDGLHYAAEWATRRANGEHETVNLGSGHGTSIEQLVEAAERFWGPIAVKYGDRRPGDVGRSVADMEHTDKVLRWTPGPIEEVFG